LDYRLNIFKNVTIRGFQEQTDPDFNIFLLYSENLPQKYKKIFNNLEKTNLFLHNVYIPGSEMEGKDYIDAVERGIEYVSFCNGMSINFRIDNDDAPHRNFISELKTFLKPESMYRLFSEFKK